MSNVGREELIIKSDEPAEGSLSVSEHNGKIVIDADHPLSQFSISITLTEDDVDKLRQFLDLRVFV